MPRVDVFPACRMRAFATLVSRELEVQVKLKGKRICVSCGPPPTIFLPAMEHAREEDLLPLYGFALHEAGHLAYTRPKAIEDCPDYLAKTVHNAIEDVYIETRLEAAFPGARDLLLRSYVEGIKNVFGERPLVAPESHLSPSGRGQVKEEMRKAGMDAGDERLVEDVARRLEIVRACKLWIIESRGYPLPLRDWPVHPWREAFIQETTPRGKNTRRNYEQALSLIRRLGVRPCLPGDERPVAEARARTATALEHRRSSRRAHEAANAARAARDGEITRRTDACPERRRWLDVRDDVAEAREELAKARKALKKSRESLREAREREGKLREQLKAERECLKALRERAAGAAGENAERVAREIDESRANIGKLKDTREHARQATAEARAAVHAAKEGLAAAREKLAFTRRREEECRNEFGTEAGRIRAETLAAHEPVVAALEKEAREREAAARKATDEANRILSAVRKRDEDAEEPLEPGALDKIVAGAFEGFRGQRLAEELDLVPRGHDANAYDSAFSEARKYCVFDRSLDRVERIEATPESRVLYEQSCRSHARTIRETAERLRRLLAPVLSRLKVNAEAGRLDPRKSYRIGLARRGCPVDLARVWRAVDPKPERKVAVSLLIDCSGSMRSPSAGGDAPIRLAAQAALCLSEVMRALSIPHEIIGHTTLSEEAASMLDGGEMNADNLLDFSRLVPFRGYLFKAFEENSAAPASLFGAFEMQDNLDGEALLWAVQRLAARPEKTKLCVSISDGMPNATLSNSAELERHLLTVCRQIEAREGKGLHLFGLGIGEERVKAFYRHAEVLNAVGDLPGAVLAIVERVMSREARR